MVATYLHTKSVRVTFQGRPDPGKVETLERRETRKVGQREEKRTREAGTKMQCSTWCFIPPEVTFRKYMFICTLNVQTYAFEMFKKILRKTNLPRGSDHR